MENTSFLSFPCKVVYLCVVFARFFVGFRGVVEMRRFYPVDKVDYLINLQWRRSHCNVSSVLADY